MFESFENKPQFENLGDQFDKPKINESEMKEQCTNVVSDFYNNGIDIQYEDTGLQSRYEIAEQFYSEIKETMGINAELGFEPMENGNLGGYNRLDNTITLNSSYLEQPDSMDLLDTILHESRHAFQQKSIDDPHLTSVDGDKITEWRDNFNYYINPEWDYEAYANQPIEKDADDFASEILTNGFESHEYFNYLT